HGNVWEWCWDRIAAYPSGDLDDDYQGASSGSRRVVRGGSRRWNEDASYLRSAYRDGYEPNRRDSCVGFRVVRLQN
ncbi:MAG: SUMF1/EgtB/PvdO family nonheme iron enzyme, partial [Bacteroidales bacterium]|nr:SUMF1/EgtB/PvdO family nonheme iron enzyme [Bacteroidales bacterium]